MGPCHSSSKKKLNNAQIPANQPEPPIQPSNIVGSPIHQQEKPPGTGDQNQNIRENMSPLQKAQEDEKQEGTPNKIKNEGNIGSSGLKKVNNRYDQSEDSINKSNAIAKQEPHQNQEVKLGSHFYYNQKENENANVGEEGIKNLEYEEHEFKEPADYKNSLHSNQLNRREIFSETKKSKFIQSKNTGDSDEPEEMVYEEIPVI